MENSFSLEFKPLSKVKSVKDYEDEIHRLKAENFDLKTRITHSVGPQAPDNLPKILYEHNQQISQLEREKQEAFQKIENLNKILEQINQDRRLLENKYNQEIFVNNEKMSLLEDENKRLVLRMEKLNRESSENSKYKSQIQEAETIVSNMKAVINNLEKQNSQISFEYNKQLEDLKNNINQIQQESKINLQNKDFEISHLKRELESEMMKNKDNCLIINDLKSTLSNEIGEKRKHCQDEESFRAKNEKLLNDNEESNTRVQKDYKNYMAGMEKFRNIISSKLQGLRGEILNISEQVNAMTTKIEISAENIKFLQKLKINSNSLNGLITALKVLFIDAHKKMEILKKEVTDTTFFAENNKRAAVGEVTLRLEEFKSQLLSAKNELILCRQYLEKKASENKNLKNENSKLIAEVARKTKQIENAKVVYNGMANNFGFTGDALRS